MSTPGAEELRELSTIRQLLDPLATEKGAERMSDATLAHLSRLLEDMRRETERGDFDALSRVDREFHLSIYEQADMPILLQLITNLRNRYAIVSRLCMEMPDYSSRSLREHEQIYEACRARDSATRRRSDAPAPELRARHAYALLPGILPQVGYG